jgi:hypothetical protein
MKLRVLVLVLAASTAFAEPIPGARRYDWTFTGVPGGIPNRTTVCATLGPGATASQINSAIASCSSGVVKLDAGTYNLTGIQLATSNVTLRGAGADQTILKGCAIMKLGNGNTFAHGAAVTAGGTKGSQTVTVSHVTGLSVGTMIEFDRNDDTAIIKAGAGVGAGRYFRQINRITSMTGTTLTLQNPFLWNFTAADGATIRFRFSNVSLSGVEDLMLDHSGTSGCNDHNFDIQYCYGCWVKGVDSYKPAGYHMVIVGTLNFEIRDSYIHDASTYGANNAGVEVYGSGAYGSNSNAKIENNVFDRLFPAVNLQNSSSGFYVGYNYSYGSMANATGAPVTWTYLDNHGPHDMMNLWEGNIGEMFGSDGYFGGSSHGTAARNFFTGYNPNFGTRDDPIRLNRASYYYNLVGNVLGSNEENPQKYNQTAENCTGGPAIYRLGYPNAGNCSFTDVTGHPIAGLSYPDLTVASTLFRWGNYDYSTRVNRFDPGEVPVGVPVPSDPLIPNSYYYSSKPAWFGNRPWPLIGPDVVGGDGDASGHVNKNPAQLCWESRNLKKGGSFNRDACYGSGSGGGQLPSAPTNLRIVAS